MIITIVGSIILIAIQTATPSFKTNKTFPNCVRSFSGYPMTGMEDTTGINYIACVLIKMKSSIPPWDTMKTMKTDKLKSRIETVLDKIKELKQIQKDQDIDFDIEIDGGINFNNSKLAIKAGANILVSGTTIFKSNDGDIKKNIDTLKLS